MTHHDILNTAGGVLGLALFIPMFIRIVRDGGVGQSCASWLLWASLDLVLIASLIQQHGNYWMFVGFVIGDITLAGTLISQRRFEWGKFETSVLGLVILCAIGWKTAGPRTATISAVAAVCIAGIPALISLTKTPDRPTARIWAGYALANGLSFFGGTAMTLEQRLAPGAFVIYSLLMVVAGWRKR